jgi:hypothetical protein
LTEDEDAKFRAAHTLARPLHQVIREINPLHLKGICHQAMFEELEGTSKHDKNMPIS